jgi:8-oxo-dGTP pyrophosphatase MutT (NUDIX family)
VTVADVRAAVAGSLTDGAVHPSDPGVATLPVELPSPDPRPAAVLCAVFDNGGQAHVVLTRRSSRLRANRGEVAFPGGRLDPGETAVDAARREAFEEVGIDPVGVEVIGRLSPLATLTTRAAITPFVGVLPGRPVLRPNPAEVDRAFTVPLVELWQPGVHHEELWSMPGMDGAAGRVERRIEFFDLEGDTVWGATGRMLRELMDRLWLLRPRG